MYWKHHPLSFVSGPSYTRKQSYISACRSPAGFIRGARGRTGGYAAVSRWLKLEETKRGQGWENEKIRERVNPAARGYTAKASLEILGSDVDSFCSISIEFTDLYEICLRRRILFFIESNCVTRRRSVLREPRKFHVLSTSQAI